MQRLPHCGEVGNVFSKIIHYSPNLCQLLHLLVGKILDKVDLFWIKPDPGLVDEVSVEALLTLSDGAFIAVEHHSGFFNMLHDFLLAVMLFHSVAIHKNIIHEDLKPLQSLHHLPLEYFGKILKWSLLNLNL